MISIGSLLPRHARYRPEHVALIVDDRPLNYREFNAYVNQLANALLAAGLKKGDKFATVLPNCLELMAAYWAAAKTGLVIVPSSPLLQESGLVTLLNDSDSVFVLADSGFTSTFREIEPELNGVSAQRIVYVGGDIPPAHIDFNQFIEDASDSNPPDADIVGDDLFNIMYSSGTTGAPKGIVHTHFVRSVYCTQFASCWRMTPESIVLHAGSIVFNGAMLDLMPWMFLGATYILHPAFDPDRVLHDIHEHQVTHMIMVPSQIIALLNHPGFDAQNLVSLQMIQNVGAPLHLEHKQRLNQLLPDRFYELYGLTEGFATVLDKNDAIRKAGSVGVPPPFYEIRILDDEGKECAPGEVGEICGRSPMLMQGYYKRPDLTEKAIVDGWLHSGDAGYLDEDGFLYLVDRIKDMIISGGVNVYPKDIEEIIIQHSAVKEVAVFGAPHNRWGETPVAAVITTADGDIEKQELIEWTNDRVAAKFQRISDVVIMPDFPRNVAGKTLKREMREEYINMSK